MPVTHNSTQTEEKHSSSWYDNYLLPCVAEFFGTLLFVFSGCASVINATNTGSLQPAVAHGLALSICVASTAGVSGGHLNPAVTLGVVISGGLHSIRLIPYWISQLLGATTGAALAKTVFSESQFANASGAAFNAMQSGASLYSIFTAEVVMTFFLVLTVCMTAVNTQSQTLLAPFCIGLVVTTSVLGAGGVSGGCMNPARAFGPAVVANYWSCHWVYWAGPLVGAALVGLVMRLLLGDPRTRLILKKKVAGEVKPLKKACGGYYGSQPAHAS
ncbi:aquaporin-8-like [Centroberyx gerrardi]|uniref:aquaporin-8-like n=1 Tax=Centroberyx gerrardi TaxID=166262 RepID=UPI003AAF30C0